MPRRSSDEETGAEGVAEVPAGDAAAVEESISFEAWAFPKRTGMFRHLVAGFEHATQGQGPLAAALREAHEEIGLESRYVAPLGYIEPYRTGTGFLVTPVIAAIKPGFTLAPDAAEVADVFEVPFDFLMDTANHRIDTLFWRGADRRFYAMPYGNRYIWGATAGIIRTLHRRLFSA